MTAEPGGKRETPDDGDEGERADGDEMPADRDHRTGFSTATV
jgi:hypothetical protein